MDLYGAFIKPLIENCGKSEMQIERDLKLPRSTIYDWNKGRSKSYMKYLPEIAAYFGVSTDYLLGNTAQKEAPPLNLRTDASKAAYEKAMELIGSLTDEEWEKVIEYAELLTNARLNHKDE